MLPCRQLNGIEAATQILRVNSQTAIIMLTMHADESYLLRALHVGVKGYLLKESAEEDLLAAIKSVAGGSPFSVGPSRKRCLRITCGSLSRRVFPIPLIF